LASAANGRFPATLQDAVTCYSYLVKDLGMKPGNIIVSGDSAGGILALALVRYLDQHAQELKLPSPSHLWLWSPWSSPITALYDAKAHDRSSNAATDYTTGGLSHWSARLFAPAEFAGTDLTPEYIQALGNQFKISAHIFVCTGQSEVFLADNVLLAKELAGVNGNHVEIFIIPNAPHDVLLMGDKLGFEAEARIGAGAAAALLR
jgi:acetyl esterase/lipase